MVARSATHAELGIQNVECEEVTGEAGAHLGQIEELVRAWHKLLGCGDVGRPWDRLSLPPVQPRTLTVNGAVGSLDHLIRLRLVWVVVLSKQSFLYHVAPHPHSGAPGGVLP